MDRKQIQIEFKDISKDGIAVEKILSSTAEKFNLFDNTVTSRVPKTIKSLVEGDGFGFGLGARIVNEFIIVDFNPRAGTSRKYKQIYSFILTKLAQDFSANVKEVGESESGYCKVYN